MGWLLLKIDDPKILLTITKTPNLLASSIIAKSRVSLQLHIGILLT